MKKHKAGDYSEFDITAYLEDKGIPYKDSSGPNVGSGWIGIHSVFRSDDNFHLGINKENKAFHCWKSGETGTLLKLITILESCDYKDAGRIVSRYTHRRISSGKGSVRSFYTPPESGFTLPVKGAQKASQAQIRYIRKRRYNPFTLIHKYDIRFAGPIGEWKHRIIIPVYMNGKLYSFTSICPFPVENKYKHCSKDVSVLPTRDCLYNIDSVDDGRIILVEGVTDVWRLGNNAVGLFGKNWTKNQMWILSEMKFERIVVMLDEDAKDRAEKLAATVGSFCSDVKMVLLEKGDPDDLTDSEAMKLKMEVLYA